MKAVILPGGKGERLKPLTDNMPKPMVSIITKPIIEFIILRLRECGFYDIAITLGYRGDDIKNHLGDGKDLGVKISYYVEESPLGTAGGVKNARDFLTEDFLVVSGDAFTELDFKEFFLYHKQKGAIATLAVKEVDDIKGFGVVKTDTDGRIIEFLEKPESSAIKTVNTGIYAMKPDIIELIPDGFFDFGKNLFPTLVGSIYAYKTDSYWSDIGTLESYYGTNAYVAKNMQKYGSIFNSAV